MKIWQSFLSLSCEGDRKEYQSPPHEELLKDWEGVSGGEEDQQGKEGQAAEDVG